MDELPLRVNPILPHGRLEAAEFLSLRRLAAHCPALPSTALVHEVYLRLAATSLASLKVDPPPTGWCLWVSMSCFAQWARLEFVEQSDCADCQIARSARNSSIRQRSACRHGAARRRPAGLRQFQETIRCMEAVRGLEGSES